MKRSRIILTTLPTLCILCAAALLFFTGCAGTSEEIADDLEPIEYFQKAQQIASEKGDYLLAIRYYETFIERYPDDLQRIVMAKYEIAFLNYKRGRYNVAMQQFDELLTYYESEGSTVLPRWPRILAEKVQENIREQQRNNGE